MYKITYRKRASNEYLASIIWYKVRSITTAQKFIEAIDNAIKKYCQPTYIL